jgi:hypothetical protein
VVENITLESLPEILTAQDIASYLKISRSSVYELLKLKPEHGGIVNIAIGISKRVEKNDFKKWLEAKKAKVS